ncbi:MAG: O-antigen ligase family protein [Thermoguttaceae bacterium]|jgi:O-antigen ligase
MEVLAVIAVVCTLVWTGVILLRGGPLAGCLLFMAVATCLSTDFFSFNAGALRMTIDRLLWAVVVLLYLIWRQRGWTDPKPLRAADKAAVALVAYLAMRTLVTDPHGTGLTPMVNLFLWYVMPLGIYWVVRQSRIDRPQNVMILTCTTLFGVYLAVTVIAERFEAYSLIYPRYIVTSMTDKTAEFVGRGRGPLLHPIITGIQLAAGFSAVLMFWPRLRQLGRCGVVLVALVFALAFYSTMTRSVWMGAGLGLVVIVGLSMPSNWRVPVLAAVVLLAGLIAVANWEQFVAFKRDKNLTAKETADSVTLRPVMARVAWLMVLDRPLWGCGFCQYLSEHKNYLADRSTELVLEKSRVYSPHNLLFGVVTETGLVGLGLFLALLTLWGYDAWLLWRAVEAPLWVRQQGLFFLAVLSAYLVNGMFHHIALIPMSNILLFFAAGLTRGVACLHRTPRAALVGGEAS